jgi:hypothetical protein
LPTRKFRGLRFRPWPLLHSGILSRNAKSTAVAIFHLSKRLPTAQETASQGIQIMNAFDIPVGAVRDVHGDEVH